MDDVPLIDTRAEDHFIAGHAPRASSFPLEELGRRGHELPPVNVGLGVVDADPRRAAAAAEILRRRGHAVTVETFDAGAACERGPSRERLWRPNPFLEEALRRIAEEASWAGWPRRALDVACGTGRDAVFLGLSGYEVQAVDVLPDALERAADLARRCGVRVGTSVKDLERDPTLPGGAYDLVTVFRFLCRDLFPALRAAVKPGGFVAYETFHERNRETGRRPTKPEHLLATGELVREFAAWDVLIHRDGVERDGRYYSSLLARKPGSV